MGILNGGKDRILNGGMEWIPPFSTSEFPFQTRIDWRVPAKGILNGGME